MITYMLGKATTGKFRFTVVECSEEWDDILKGYVIKRKYGQVRGKTVDGPLIIVDRPKQKRTWKEQYILQYNSEVKKYLDKGYIKTEKHPNEYTDQELNELFGDVVTNQFGVLKPMLAKQESKVSNRKIFDKEWLASRKINGTRCLMYLGEDHKIHTASRGGNTYEYSTIHIRENPTMLNIFNKYPNIILDGELYKHGKSLQQISGAARLEKNAIDCDWLEYYLYDVIDTKNMKMIAEDREKFLSEICNEFNCSGFNPYKEWNKDELQVQLVPQIKVSGWDNIQKLHDEYVSEGFEGLVIRDPNCPYRPNGRSNDMIKIKHYLDDTFKIIGYELGLRGSEDMTFICEMSDGKTFKATPMGDRITKQEYVDNFENKYKNCLGDCKYFELSDSGIPVQPTFIAFRFDLKN